MPDDNGIDDLLHSVNKEKIVEIKTSSDKKNTQSSEDIVHRTDVDEILDDIIIGEAGEFEVEPENVETDATSEVSDSIDIDKIDSNTSVDANNSIQGVDSFLDNGITPSEQTSENSVPESKETLETEASETEPAQQEPEEHKSLFLKTFTIKGNKSWNTREPYILSIDESVYKKNMEELKKTFFYVFDEQTNQTLNDSILKTNLSKFLRNPRASLIEEYKIDAKRFISNELNGIYEYFAINDNKELFAYHLGPLTIFQILKETVKLKNIGVCYCQVGSKQIKKIIPEEYLKFLVCQWMEDNINAVDLKFDSVYNFDIVKNLVAQKYQKVLKVFNHRHYELNLKMGPNKNISREKLVQVKGDAWFGIRNIIIYKRFIPNTIFS